MSDINVSVTSPSVILAAVTSSPINVTVSELPAFETPAYSNVYGIGDRQAIITPNCSGSTFWGNIYTTFMLWHIDGNTGNDGGYTNNNISVAGEWYEWNFHHRKLITEIRFYFNAGTADCGVWRTQGYDGASWNNIGNTFTLGTASTQTIDLSTNQIGYTKYRILGVSGVSNYNLYYWSEIEFKIGSLL